MLSSSLSKRFIVTISIIVFTLTCCVTSSECAQIPYLHKQGTATQLIVNVFGNAYTDKLEVAK
jgi:hypothetical protein